MAHCPYCLSVISKTDIVCHSCGAEKGYVYFRRKARGALFTLLSYIVLPILVSVSIPLLFRVGGMPFVVAMVLSCGATLFAVYKLVIGPVWFR